MPKTAMFSAFSLPFSGSLKTQTRIQDFSSCKIYPKTTQRSVEKIAILVYDTEQTTYGYKPYIVLFA